MQATRFDAGTRALAARWSRRGLFGLIAGNGVTWLGLGSIEAKKRRKKKHKNKKKCGKAGQAPVKGKCCAGAVLVDAVCQRCDVCPSGCAFATLQVAINAAIPGATLAVCPGTYAGGLTISKDLRLMGAGDGAGGSDTVVQGAGDTPVVKITTGSVVLKNLRITGGGGGDGAGVNLQGGTVELNSCTVSGNTGPAAAFGGGIFNGGTLHLIGSTVRDNRANGGGGIYNTNNRSLTLTNSEISGNTGTAGGGGIYNFAGATVLFDAASRVTGNIAGITGGGIYNNGGTVTLVSSANVSGNTPNNCAGMPAVALCSG